MTVKEFQKYHTIIMEDTIRYIEFKNEVFERKLEGRIKVRIRSIMRMEVGGKGAGLDRV